MKFKLLLATLGIFTGWVWSRQKPKQPISLKNAVTIITGGASGIGKATAHAMARQGAIVIIADLEHQLTDELKQEFAPYATPIHFITCDITQAEHRQALVQEVMTQHESIDILINNAGMSVGGAFTNSSPDAIDKLIEINLLATIHLTHVVLKIMKKQNRGHIVNISSINAKLSPPGEAIYSASKAGLNAFSDSLRRELAQNDIHVSTVMPALTQTAMLNDLSEAELRQNQLLMPGVQLDTAKHVADAILSAIQYNKREVICGGHSMQWLTQLSPLRPSAVDWVFKYVINTEKFMQTLGKLGKQQELEEG